MRHVWTALAGIAPLSALEESIAPCFQGCYTMWCVGLFRRRQTAPAFPAQGEGEVHSKPWIIKLTVPWCCAAAPVAAVRARVRVFRCSCMQWFPRLSATSRCWIDWWSRQTPSEYCLAFVFEVHSVDDLLRGGPTVGVRSSLLFPSPLNSTSWVMFSGTKPLVSYFEFLGVRVR